MATQASRVLITGVDTTLGAAVREYFIVNGSATVGTTSTPVDSTDTESNLTLQVQYGDADQVRDAVRRADDAMGGVDALVVAHALPLVAGVNDQSMDEFWGHVDSALTGSFLFAQAAGERIRDGGTRGRIVLTTSRWHVGGADLSAVATAAGGIVALTKTLTRDFGSFGVGVNAVSVGAVESEWSVCDAAATLPPTGRVGSVQQVARVIGLLCRPQLGAAVGQIVNVDGGLSRNRV